MISREDVPRRVAALLGRPARWASLGSRIGDYDGSERTLEVFNAEPRERRALLRALRAERPDLERAAGGPWVIVFHTPAETRRLYADVLTEASRRARYVEVAEALTRWMTEAHGGQSALEPGEIERFSFDADEAA